jgi:hypothetical protein
MAPLFMKTVLLSLKVGAGTAKTFTCLLKSASVDAAAGDTVEYPTLSAGCTYRQLGPTIYELHLVGVQDHDPSSSSGLSAFLDTNDGLAASFWLQAYGEAVAAAPATPAKAGSCVIAAGSYGGEVQTFAEFDVTLPISGKPTTATTGAAPAFFEALEAGEDLARFTESADQLADAERIGAAELAA